MTDTKLKTLAILGASGHGKVVADLAEQCGYSVVFYDDAYPAKTTLEHWPILGTFEDLLHQDKKTVQVVVAIGNNAIRQTKVEQLTTHNFNLPVLIHPSSIVSKYATLKLGSLVLAGSVINAFATIGKGVIVNSAAVVEHDCVIGDYSHICPSASLAGGTKIGSNVWVGIGSQVKQLVTIGDNVLIGAGSTVLHDLPNDVVAFGSPAKIIRPNL